MSNFVEANSDVMIRYFRSLIQAGSSDDFVDIVSTALNAVRAGIVQEDNQVFLGRFDLGGLIVSDVPLQSLTDVISEDVEDEEEDEDEVVVMFPGVVAVSPVAEEVPSDDEWNRRIMEFNDMLNVATADELDGLSVNRLVRMVHRGVDRLCRVPGEGPLDVRVEIRTFLAGYDLFLTMEVLKRKLNVRHAGEVFGTRDEFRGLSRRQFNLIMTGAKKLFELVRRTNGGCLCSELYLGRQIIRNQPAWETLERSYLTRYILLRGRRLRSLRPVLWNRIEENNSFLE
ncbi:MAG: hypothetical protein EXX96DRAFT_612932 [Benjaminiella poitrasii]|nr:MAG: hypothetical protein EXX96DRAFT_612932 [Benjaminiella poitrasii]